MCGWPGAQLDEIEAQANILTADFGINGGRHRHLLPDEVLIQTSWALRCRRSPRVEQI